MKRFATFAAATAMLAAPAFAQTTTEVADEIFNASEDMPIEQSDSTPLTGEVDCMDPAAEVVNESTDSENEMIGCTTGASGEPEFGEEIFEDLEEADDDNN